MNVMMHRARMAALVLAVPILAACVSAPEPQPIVIEEPVDAFNAVGQPYTPNDGRYGGSLSTDIERLQNARRLYELTRERQQQAVEYRQQRCLEQSDSRRVPIQGAPDDAVFCEPAVGSQPAAPD